MSNSVDPDETAHYEPSYLNLCGLQKPIIIAYGSGRVTYTFISSYFQHSYTHQIIIKWYFSYVVFFDTILLFSADVTS